MCDCQSYNRPDLGGTVPERVLPYAKYFPNSARDTVCVDDCIADMMEKLWAAGVVTGACCCGHNGQSTIANGRPNVMIVDPRQAQIAHDILAADPRDWWVAFWAGGAPANEGGV